jgi:hypothetical protein
MFEGTDLSMAYGSGGFDNYSSGSSSGMFPQQQQQQQMPQQPPALPLPKSTTPHSMPPDPVYNPPPAMYAQQSASPSSASGSAMMPPDSFWDKIARKKWEVFKYFVMSLIVVLALSIDHTVCHYMSSYISKGFFTETQELLIRIGYPVGIIVLIWILKASV